MDLDRVAAVVASFFGESRVVAQETAGEGATTYVFVVPWAERTERRVRATLRDGLIVLALEAADTAPAAVAAAPSPPAEPLPF